jgi:hypothetical protein
VTNPDLPQFDPQNPSNGWTEVGSSYDVSAFLFSIPIALQVITVTGIRTVTTGLLTGTWDEYKADGVNGWTIARSIFSFKDGDPIVVQWNAVEGVLVLVATEFPQEGEGDAPE